MKLHVKFIIVPLIVICVFTFFGFKNNTKTNTYKCMIQMKNYTGEGAYVVISQLNNKRDYLKTLYIQGSDSDWYSDITEWWQFYGKRRLDIDAITGETISGGERSIAVITIDEEAIDKGQKLRFETAVEDQNYYIKDIEIELTTENLRSKIEGTGFIRYIRLMPQ